MEARLNISRCLGRGVDAATLVAALGAGPLFSICYIFIFTKLSGRLANNHHGRPDSYG